MSTSSNVRIGRNTRVEVAERETSVWIDVQEAGEGSGAALFARTPEGFDRLAEAATEAARRMRAANGQELRVS